MNTDNINALIKLLSDKDGYVREKARLALVGMEKEATAPLMELLTARDQQTRWEAAKALGTIADPSAIPALIDALEDKIFDIRWLAAEALVAIGQESIPPLLKALQERTKESFLIEGARHTIKYILRDNAQAIELKELLKPVVAALEGQVPRVETPGAAQTALIKLKIRKGN
ncbi:MAG: HEAT repeat domain-containing protein [Dehalococcoidales bacterium]|nr:HEAT repeat domain-containing protein [Dehalococcoidales bacterium]